MEGMKIELGNGGMNNHSRYQNRALEDMVRKLAFASSEIWNINQHMSCASAASQLVTWVLF
jgi:hypothetical protein